MGIEAVIGLEVHVQLATRTKLFCPCPVDFGGEPNSRICPVCTGQPGVLPVLNRRALELAIVAGLALDCTIPPRIVFDRKNYFYPDLPKGYQISQFDRPIAERGRVLFELPEGATGSGGIVRAHIEEDAGKAIHPPGEPISQVDLNRAGIPLIEIVGEPDLRSPQEAGAFLTALRRTLRYAGVSDCDMEKGSMRCDANVSVRPTGSKMLGVKVEVKNMNSIRNVERALRFEIERQTRKLESGNRIVQETRSFRDDEGVTISMRVKEGADDYRYFPDPDLPEFEVPPPLVDQLRAGLAESWPVRRQRYITELGLGAYEARVLTDERAVADFFEACVAAGVEPATAANWVQGEVLAYLGAAGASPEDLRIGPAQLRDLVQMIDAGQLSHQASKKVFKKMLDDGLPARAAAEALDLLQIRDEDLLARTVDEILRAEPDIVADYQSGKKAALNALLGRTMKALRGKGDPARIRKLLLEKLGS